MCGIAGFVGADLREDEARADLDRMTQVLRHRGPDDDGFLLDCEAGVALGHRRLAIIDLSSGGHQPMTSSSGRYSLTYNGEIYNFPSIRTELVDAGHSFRGHSDTEVALEAIERWGLHQALHRFSGMFAFALWDHEERSLHLVRDRFGKKPLYYSGSDRLILFGSELKALRAHSGFKGTISRAALTLYFRFNCIPAPYTIFEEVLKVPAGSIVSVRPGQAPSTPVAYWSVQEAFAAAVSPPFGGTEEDAANELSKVLGRAVSDRMISDVPLGAFLSGGIDSSSIVALMQQAASRPIKTFTIGFHEPGFNEAEIAKKVAHHLETDHTELYLSPGAASDVIPRLATIYDEPFADSSQIPTFLISEMTRRHVTVSLSGDGGDELFGGYNRYLLAKKASRLFDITPRRLRQAVGRIMLHQPAERWDAALGLLTRVLPKEASMMARGDRVHKVGETLMLDDAEGLYLRLVSSWQDPASVVLGGREPSVPWTSPGTDEGVVDPLDKMMLRDAVGYLHDDILVKLDRASMAVSLEARAPFLDHRVAELAWSLPPHMKVHGGEGKRVLRRLLYRHVPEHLFDRPKMGFALPVGRWLRQDLRPWAEDLLQPSRLDSQGFLDTTIVRELWRRHLEGPRDRQHELWAVLMFQAWLQDNTGA